MNWSSQKTKNYLHMAAERDLSRVLQLLLDRARSPFRLMLEDQWKKWFKQILRVQGILEEKTTEFDWTGLSPGPEVHFLDTVLKWRNGWLLIIYNFSVHLSAKFLSESCLKAFMEAGFCLINKFITYIKPLLTTYLLKYSITIKCC